MELRGMGNFMKQLKNIFLMQLRHMISRREFKISLGLSMLFVTAAFLESCFTLWGKDRSELYSASAGWVGNINLMQNQTMQVFYFLGIFIIAALAFSDDYLISRNNRILPAILARTSFRQYFLSGTLASFLGGFIVILIPLAISQLLSFLVLPFSGVEPFLTNASWEDTTYTAGYLFPFLKYQHPYLNNMVFLVYASVFAGIMSAVSYLISFFIRRSKLFVIGLPSIIAIVFGAVLAIVTGSGGFAVDIYLYPNDAIQKYPAYFFFLPLALLAGAIIGMFFILHKYKEEVL